MMKLLKILPCGTTKKYLEILWHDIDFMMIMYYSCMGLMMLLHRLADKDWHTH